MLCLPGRSPRRRSLHRRRRAGERGTAVGGGGGSAAQQGPAQAEQGLTQPALHGPQVAARQGEQRGGGRHWYVLNII